MRTAIGGFAVLLLLGGCSEQVESRPEQAADLGVKSEVLIAAAPPLPSAVTTALSSSGPIAATLLNTPFTIEHLVPVGVGRKIHLWETFTLRSFLRFPHRGLLTLPGPLTKGDFFNIEVDGYRDRERLAKRGFFVASADFEGTGLSTFPADGKTPTLDTQVQAMRVVVEYLRLIRLIPKVDVTGDSWGGDVAGEVCADAVRVRSCVLSSMLYKTPSDFAKMFLINPGFLAFLDSLPNHYWVTMASDYFPIINGSPSAVQDWTALHEPGPYQTAALYDIFHLPSFDPTLAKVPGLIIQGEFDPNPAPGDVEDLANDWGGGTAQVVVVAGAGHVPRVEVEPSHETFMSALEHFIDP